MATKVFCRTCGNENLLEPQERNADFDRILHDKADKLLCQYCYLRMTTNVELLINLGIADITLRHGTIKCSRCKWTSFTLASFCFKCGNPFTQLSPEETYQSFQSFSKYAIQKVGDNFLGRFHVRSIYQKGLSTDYIVFDREEGKLLRIKISHNINFIDRIADIWLNIPPHKNIVKAYSKKIVNDISHLFLEYVAGTDLGRVMRENESIEISKVLEIAIQICEGMEHLWSIGIVHRDLKPDNIIVGDDGIVRINDLEIAELVSEHEASTRNSLGVCGTPSYMSPEQFGGTTNIDNRSDIYSFGITLYEMICGIRPFEYISFSHWNRTSPVQEPKTLKPSCPGALSNLIVKCLEKKPENRYQSFGELKEELYKIKGII
jgi:serine/threonine protein kinase